jgi:hypothetical protein
LLGNARLKKLDDIHAIQSSTVAQSVRRITLGRRRTMLIPREPHGISAVLKPDRADFPGGCTFAAMFWERRLVAVVCCLYRLSSEPARFEF